MSILAILLAIFVCPVSAQDGTGPIPENAHERRYGDGWECDLEYREDHGSCRRIVAPENAYATGQSYGAGWACYRGFKEAGASSCAKIFVPENAFLRASGYDWRCERGYRKERNACVPIVLPDHAYLTDDLASGAGWTCDRGFAVNAGNCLPIIVPENGARQQG